MALKISELKNKVSPMMRQYIETKEQYQDELLFYRLGDFYEMFFDDAQIASKELELTLTGRDCGLPERAPMCGIPYHAVEKYIAKLIEKGYKVAICEQMEDPALAKGLVARDITRIVTPGTLTESSLLEADKNNYIMSVYLSNGKLGIAYADISTGEFYVQELSGTNIVALFRSELSSIHPNEVIYNSNDAGDDNFHPFKEALKSGYTSPYYDWCFTYKNAFAKLTQHFEIQNLNCFGIDEMKEVIIAAGALMEYLYETQRSSVSQIISMKIKHPTDYMYMDNFTRKNLELVENIRTRGKKGSLLGLMDKTKTAPGARMLRRWFSEPLLNYFEIENRLDGVEELFRKRMYSEELGEALSGVRDIERIASRISTGSANARELVALRDSIELIPRIKEVLSSFSSKIISDTVSSLDSLSDIASLIRNTISDDPPIALKDGGTIREGYNEELDRMRRVIKDGSSMVLSMEADEREKTGIKNLKINYNKVFGYYIDVTNSFKELVPDRYIRRQTLANSERYITPELKELEDLILNSETRINKLEAELYLMVRSEIAQETERLQKASSAVALLDSLLSLADVALENNYVRPHLNTNGVIKIRNGRHPVIESNIPKGSFVGNDAYLDSNENKVIIITGPNMAGKSTFMRQVAVICFMMQVGSFVPCDSADLCIVDRIFTRAGATDDISQGQSTFMVEMNEVASILRNATENSLLIFDEIGRGTSTYDGLSIAWAVVEHVADKQQLGAKTLFATHYHELTELESKLSGVKNYHVITKEFDDDIVFLRKIVAGEALHSYGIQVAKLAGVPDSVISRAKEILKELETNDINKPKQENTAAEKSTSPETEKAIQLRNELKRMNTDKITAIEALVILDDLKKRFT